MASIRKTPNSPYWQAVITLPDGTRTNRSTKSKDKTTALRLAAEYQEASNRGREGSLVADQVRRVFNDLLTKVGAERMNGDSVETYLRTWLKGKNNPSTLERYSHTVDLFLDSLDGKRRSFLSAVDYRDVLAFIEKRERQGIAPKTISVDAKTLNTAFNLARKLGHISSNPVEKALALNPIEIESSERETFSEAQIEGLLRCATGDWITAILLGYFTGARLSDCANMKWSNVDLDLDVLDFVQEKLRRRNSLKKRVVCPLHPDLGAHLRLMPNCGQGDFLCPSLADKSTSGEHGLSKTFAKLMQKAGIDCKRVEGKGIRKFSKLSFHSLRHSFNSVLANKDVDQETRTALTGQTSLSVNDDYTHFDIPKLRRAIVQIPRVNYQAAQPSEEITQ
jgi:integrase